MRMNGFRNRPLWSGKQSFRAVLSMESCSGLCLTRLMCGSTGDVFYRSLQIHFVKRVTAFSEALSEEVKLWFGCGDVDRRSHRSAAIYPRPASVMWRCYHGDAAAVVMERECGGLFPELLADALMHVYMPRLFLQHVPSSRLMGNKSRLITFCLIFLNTRFLCSVDILVFNQPSPPRDLHTRDSLTFEFDG